MKSIEQILRTASPQVRAICLSLLRQLAKARRGREYKLYEGKKPPDGFTWSLNDEVDPRARYADTRVEPSGRKID